MKFLIVEPSPLPIFIPLGPKYSPQDPVKTYIINILGILLRHQLIYIKIYKFNNHMINLSIDSIVYRATSESTEFPRSRCRLSMHNVTTSNAFCLMTDVTDIKQHVFTAMNIN